MYRTSNIPTNLTQLKDINDVKPLSSEDQPLVTELTEVLKKYNALDRFGITLLHQHFNIANDEILMEETDVTSRTHIIRPVARKGINENDTIQTTWRLDCGTAVQICVCQRDSKGYHSSHVKL